MRAIEVCRTAVLGGHKDQCDHCGHLEISYNSCRNRHCPNARPYGKKNGSRPAVRISCPSRISMWSLPSPQNSTPDLHEPQGSVRSSFPFGLRNAHGTRKRLETSRAQIGSIGILHTWGQNLMDHPHIHCIVTGVDSPPTKALGLIRKGFFIPSG